MFLVRLFAICGALVATSLTATANNHVKPSFMKVHGQALPPYGFVEFCRTFKESCAQPARLVYSRFDATPARLSELDQINRLVNHRIAPKTDRELYGLEEYWTYPVTSGDCEDYVVLKRKLLIQKGWPANALLITVVRDEIGDGHAILTVRTRQGDFVLDNKVDDVRIWSQTPYQYLMRQSYLNPQVWVALDPRISSQQVPVAGVNSTD